MRWIVIATLVAACSKPKQVAVDCDKYIAHMDELATKAIDTLPADQQAAASARLLAKRPELVATCHDHPTMAEANYTCEMAATTRDEWKACGK